MPTIKTPHISKIQDSEDTPFDNSGNGFTADNAKDAIVESQVDVEQDSVSVVENCKAIDFQGDIVAEDDGNSRVRVHVGAESKSLFEIAIATGTSAYRQIGSQTYQSIATFRFPGTDVSGFPTSIKLIAGGTDILKSASYKVVDLDTSNVVVELSGNFDIYPAIIDLGTLVNLSAGESIWDVQVKIDQAGAKVKIASLSLEF